MKQTLFLALILLSAVSCAKNYGTQFNARTPAQTKATEELQKTKPAPIVVSGAKTNVFEAVPLGKAIDPNWLKPSTEPFRLGPGDKVELELVSDPLSTRVTSTVGPDGKLYFYLLPGIDVWGMTLDETRARLEEDLKKYMRDKPQVGITLREVASKRIWMLGRLQAPGVYSMTNAMTLLEAVSSAGGTVNPTGSTDVSQLASSEELADLHRSFVIRKGQMLPVDFHRLMQEGDLSQNIYLEPDDFVYMPPMASREIYVMGAVQTPRAVSFHEGISLIDAIANSGGPAYNSYLSHVAIVRGSLTDPKIAIVDYKSILHGNATDIILQPRDIVYVPLSPYRHLRRYFELIQTTFVSSVAINEGSRAVLKAGAAPTGILIPFGSKISISPTSTPSQ
ncbi:MAG: Polysaccharide export protein [Verrucomicrobiales bacterium]|nr:Polysaccharide export protein [Verrucomicrobiales bacterium]